MRKHIQYLWYVLRHKWFVFVECVKLGIPLHGIFHDWHKFLPGEWFPYVNHFYGDKPPSRNETGYYKPTDTGDPAFDFAWLLHQKRGRHHWQWWILPEDDGGMKVLPMPDKYRREMLADWRGAGKAQGTPDTRRWYATNYDKIIVHRETRQWLDKQIFDMAYPADEWAELHGGSVESFFKQQGWL